MISSIVATAQRSYNARNVALSSQCSRLFRRVPFITQCRQFEIFFSVVEIEPRQASTLLELVAFFCSENEQDSDLIR